MALVLAFTSRAQILDDSTELVYGPSTVQVVYENHIKDNLTDTVEVDTTITDLENFWFVDRNQRKYQDLGNVGTALFPVFYQDQPIIGRTSGFNAYQHYNIKKDQHRYYDTKSPFMDLLVVLGGQGRAVIDYSYSQNITPNWNFGINVHKLNIDKQIGADQTQGDRNVENTSGDIFTYWAHPEKDYNLFFYLSGFTHQIDETGGIAIDSGATRADRFQYRDSNIRLNDAIGSEKNINAHLFHELGIFNQLEIYHSADFDRQFYGYQDNRGGSTQTYDDFYPNFFLDPDSTFLSSTFRTWTNEAGISGDLSSLYYRIYLKNRLVNHSMLYGGPYGNEVENYLGAKTRFTWKDLFDVTAEGEAMTTGEFRLEGQLNSSLLKIRYSTIRYKQANLLRRYLGNHYQWNNSFDAGFTNTLTGELNLELGGIEIHPFAQFKNLNNYVYFNENSRPELSVGPTLITRVGGKFNFFIPTGGAEGRGFHLNNEVYYTLIDEESQDFIRIPELFYVGKYYWNGRIFGRAVPFQTGFNVYAKSSFFANDYNPVLQQFFVQNNEQLNAFFTADLFANMQVERFTMFVKVVYVNMGVEDGYFITPLYPGQERVVDVGVRWLFFD